jgi:hypothetical protein
MTTPVQFASNHWFLSFSGSLPGGETWSCGFRVLDTVPPVDEAASQTVCAAYAAAIAQWFEASTLIHFNAALTTVKMNWIGTNGRYIHPYTSRVDYEAAVHASGNGVQYPNQIALVVTLGTGVARGLAHQGRIFLPLPSKPIDATLAALTNGDQVLYADSVKALLNTLNGLDATRRISIMSKGTPKHPAGQSLKVTTVEVGAALDTMRSRRRKIVEHRVSKPLTFA